jgi:HSP20 family molecular chaperone IbpA
MAAVNLFSFEDDNEEAKPNTLGYGIHLAERPDYYVIQIDVPGIPKSSLRVTMSDENGRKMTISGIHEVVVSIEGAKMEPFKRSVQINKSFIVPSDVDMNLTPDVSCADGLVTVFLMKKKKIRDKIIRVK